MVNKIVIGEKAPNFSLPDKENRIRSLKEFLGQEVVLVFFIEAFTSTSTKEVCPFRDSMKKMTNLKAQVVGVDVNNPVAVKVFAEKNRLHFPILIDQNGELSKSYGIEGPSILILNEEGNICYKWASREAIAGPNYEEIEAAFKTLTSQKQVTKRTFNVVTISRQIGSEGDEIALKICKTLGYSYFDKNMMYDAAKKMGISDGHIADYSEDLYKIKSLVDKILGRKRLVATTLKENTAIRKTLEEEKCLEVVQTVINNLAGRGEMVIVGRGGQAILKNKSNVFHIRIIAPLEFRIKRLMEKEKIGRDEALKLIDENDKAVAEYLYGFYGINWDEPLNYNLVLNTANIDLETASKAISLFCSPKRKRTSKTKTNNN
jgi:peroxiredoxin/cytidylate kinase